MDDTPTAEEPKRFVPLGVDAQSWIGFEHRIQERRYRALLQQITEAISRRDAVAARLALEEARELRLALSERSESYGLALSERSESIDPADDLDELGERVALIPIAAATHASAPFVWSRAMNAVSLLVAGVGLLVAIEWVRPPRPLPSRAIAATVVTAPTLTARLDQPTPDAPIAAAIPADPVVASAEPDVALPDPVATTGIRPAVNVARPAAGGPATSPFRPEAPALNTIEERPRPVPDDDAAPESRRQREASVALVDNTPAVTTVDPSPRQPSRIEEEVAPTPPPPSASAVVASVAPNPTSVALVPSTVPAAARALEPRARANEETRVTQVLDQYARAYDQLDVRAARKVWPTVDERALARAFASLASQDVSFDNCNVSVSGPTATASCRGHATYVGKIGSRDRRTEARQWTFQLRRDANDAWQIERAQAARMTN